MICSKFFLVLLFSLKCIHGFGQQDAEWPAYGRDAGGSRYSPLKQINDSTIKHLSIAWTYHTGELETYTGTDALSKAAFEATPIMIADKLYFSTPTDRVFALQASDGKKIWSFDPKINLAQNFSEITSRGVAAWPASRSVSKSNPKPEIIFIATIDGRLIALNASSGIPVSSFGQNGTIDLKKGYGANLSVTSPPAIFGNLVVVGSSLGDNNRYDETKGAVRAFDVKTGMLQWTWDAIPGDSTDPGWKTWEGPKAHRSGAANVWSMISVDPVNELLFVPASSPSPDYYGGERLGQNLYGNSIVAIHAKTGKVSWYYQVVHHDLWDYDIAAQPMLIDIEQNGQNIPAVVVGTKMGHIFILNRITGKPLFPVEERPVASSSVPGEFAWPTQPIPIKPEPVGLQKVGSDDAWGINDAEKAVAQARISKYINNGIFTPPSLKGSIMTPGNVGGIHWGGMCYDADQKLLITNINRLAAVITLVPRQKTGSATNTNEELLRVETGNQLGTPYIVKRDYLFKIDNGDFRMQVKPPWGTILAIDLKDGEKKWEEPLGFMMDPQKYPESKNWGSINFGGAIVTKGNITLVAASLDGYFRAFNTKTGNLLWEYLLPAGGQATPMTYSIKGKQYIVIAAGGHGKIRTKQGDSVIAFCLK